MLVVDPKNTPIPDLHQFIVGSVAPRPIAFVSTINEDGVPNLAPYSFFNAYSSNPPTVIFSSNRRVRDNTTKDTLANVKANGEVVINMVNYAIVRQMAIASVEYPEDVSEFDKAGLTAVPSDVVKPYRVAESPIQMECRVKQILPLGEEGGAGNLVICEILRMHIAEEIIDDNRINPYKADLMGRMGRAFYCRASGDAVFPIVQKVTDMAIGFDGLPKRIRQSKVLTGHHLAMLASVTLLPSEDVGETLMTDERVMNIVAGNAQERENHLHHYAKELLDEGEVGKAWAVLMLDR